MTYLGKSATDKDARSKEFGTNILWANYPVNKVPLVFYSLTSQKDSAGSLKITQRICVTNV